MKKYLILFFILAVSPLLKGQYVYVKGKKFMLNDNEFYPVGMNYIVDIVKDPNSGDLYITPNHSYGPSIDCEHDDATNSLNEIRADFRRMRDSMGVNSIRLIGLAALEDDPTVAGLSFKAYLNVHPIYSSTVILTTSFTPTYSGDPGVNPNCAKLFGFIESVLSIAAEPEIDFKVTLLVGGAGLTAAQRIDTEDYLAAVAEYFSSNTALFAYDLANELGGWNGATNTTNDGGTGVVPNKEDVCNVVNLLSGALKANDANHLVTIGELGPTDVEKWDPGIMNLDFISFHPYAYVTDPTDANKVTLGINRVLSEIYWCGNNIKQPWIIGETGFSALPSYSLTSSCGVDGDYTDQQTFAEATLTATRACGAAGYTYWNYQDVYWDKAFDSYIGLIDHGDILKPAVDAFVNFDPYTAQAPYLQPDNYFTPNGILTYSVTGTVRDQYNNPIKDAVVTGWTSSWTIQGHTYTDINGVFTLYSDSIIGRVRTASAGAEVKDLNVSPWTFTLSVSSQHQNITLTSPTVSYPTVVAKETYNNITASTNYIVDGNGSTGGDVTFKAGGEIHLNPGFEVKRGGTFHAMYGIPINNCSDGVYSRTSNYHEPYFANTSPSQHISWPHGHNLNTQQKDSLTNTISSVVVSINPNPTISGKTEIFISDISNVSQIIVMDMFGRTIQRTTVSNNNVKIDISNNPKGVYLVKIIGTEKTIIKKVVYN